jgi:N-acetylmuramic acid 6-phosphate etherase
VLETEQRRQETIGIDTLSSAELVGGLLRAHEDVPAVVAAAEAETTSAIDAAAGCLALGGRLIYAASGTPAGLVAADAAEIPPTFGFPSARLKVVRARSAMESGGMPDEDSSQRGREAIIEAGVTSSDIVVGIASSGSTPFTTGAVRAAREQGALTVGVVNVANGPVAEAAAISVHLLTGAEPIMGSTRMRAGLAQKLWLNIFSTAVMVTLGSTFDNLMVNVAPSLEKLRARRLAILQEATGLPTDSAAELLDAAADDLRCAIVMGLANVDCASAEAALKRAEGRVRAAIEDLPR